MAEITEFKKEGKRAFKIQVFVAGELWATLDPETIVRAGLKKGEELSRKREFEILAVDEAIRARKAAATHTAGVPKTRRELEQFLLSKGFSVKAREAAIETLVKSGTIDDERTSERLVRSRRKRRDVGPARLEAELRHRGVESGLAEKQVEEALEGADLRAECFDLAQKLARRYQPLTESKQRQKLAAALMRRGYGGEDVWSALRRVSAEPDPDGEDAGADAETE